MGKRKYRTVAAVVLAGAALFSPLLCGMTCRERLRMRPEAAQTVAPATELTGEFVRSALVGCVLTRLVSEVDFSEWADQADVATWVWVGVEVLRLSHGAWRGEA